MQVRWLQAIGAMKANRPLLAEEICRNYLDMKPGYFNSGCCCFSDGDITGIEIENGFIRLIKWELVNERPQRILLEEISLEQLAMQL